MIPSVRVGWSPDVTAIYTAASQIFDEVGLYSWEPYSTQPTKQALLTPNFILLLWHRILLFQKKWLQESTWVNLLWFGFFFGLMHVICNLIHYWYTNLNNILFKISNTDISMHQYMETCLEHFKCIKLRVIHVWLQESPQALFSPLWLTGGNFKSKHPFFFGLGLADYLRGI